MTESNQPKSATPEQAPQDLPFAKRIKSFVVRAGRISPAHRVLYNEQFAQFGLTIDDGLLDYEKAFANQNPVVLEIGFGMGKSLLEMAEANPNLNYIGIEVHTPGVARLLREANEKGLTNIRVYEHDAIEVLDQCIADASLQSLQLYFPDPWHKKRHHKRRIVQPEFAQTVRKKIKVGGTFHMATDWENYAEHMLEVMEVQPGYENLAGKNQYHPRPDFRPLTKFEVRGENKGHGVWDLIYKRID
ncbi:tRNA (guanosine(46)-N7)-methyltransferase TrmB [Bermanella sp. R86510]|uniref:tRNA (guanosine(46)-N7)-methyltransferase TrmB n=1 Tax=unclassified Bermanella TaxID=2627862 RepID=UPI0037C97B5F